MRYILLHTSRLIITTIIAMIRVEARSKSKRPASLALLIVLPNPGASTIFPWKWKYSATILAFHAPPDAVTIPVTR